MENHTPEEKIKEADKKAKLKQVNLDFLKSQLKEKQEIIEEQFKEIERLKEQLKFSVHQSDYAEELFKREKEIERLKGQENNIANKCNHNYPSVKGHNINQPDHCSNCGEDF